MSHSNRHATDAGRWPWSCRRCGAPVYHDARLCGECEDTYPGRGQLGYGRVRTLVARALATVARLVVLLVVPLL